MFDPLDYAWNVAHGPGLAPCKVRKADMPVTLADHEAAEREARKTLDERLEGRNRDVETVSDMEAIYEAGCLSDEASNLADWGFDIHCEARAWEKIAQDLLDFKAKATAKKAA